MAPNISTPLDNRAAETGWTRESILAALEKRAQIAGYNYRGLMTPAEAWWLAQNAQGLIVDTRTQSEWDWVGRIPSNVLIEWFAYPSRVRNAQFLEQLAATADKDRIILFLCRSATRSHAAAQLAHDAGFKYAFNILEGFEGKPDSRSRRGFIDDWRHADLPWQQG